jgi:hypothetical protein
MADIEITAKMANSVQQALLEATLLSLKLKDINILVVLDWEEPLEYLQEQLAQLVRALVEHPQKERITVLIDTRGIPADLDGQEFLGEVLIELFLNEGIEVIEGPEINLTGALDPLQWQILQPKLQGEIILSANPDLSRGLPSWLLQ